MPVGTGSIKRAAKLNAGKAEPVKETVNTKINESVSTGENAEEAANAEIKNNATTKKKTTKKVSAVKQQEGNQACCLTEELPIYLL